MQENRNLSNYQIMASRVYSLRKVAYWGHGRNFQSDAPDGLRERWKRFLLTRVDWWFAYTEETVHLLRSSGYAEDRITCLNNAIDNDQFLRELSAVSEDRVAKLRAELNVEDNAPVGLFCGSLYPDKRLDFMVAAADKVRMALPNFCLIVIGGGSGAAEMSAAAATRPWLKYVGVRMGLEKAEYFKLADICFNPGAVGLHVLDAFCAGIPLATTSEARHGPEIAYLKNGENGIITRGSPEDYAKRIVSVLSNLCEYQKLCLSAKEASTQYTLGNMVNHFADGIERCLSLSR